jgi:hypothetical protein
VNHVFAGLVLVMVAVPCILYLRDSTGQQAAGHPDQADLPSADRDAEIAQLDDLFNARSHPGPRLNHHTPLP